MNVLLNIMGGSVTIPETLEVSTALFLGLVVFLSFLLITGLSYLELPKVVGSIINSFSSNDDRGIYRNLIAPHQRWLIGVTIFIVVDLIILGLSVPDWLRLFEFPIGLLISVNVVFLGFSMFEKLFDKYLLGVTLENHDKINSELLVLAKFISNSVIVLIVVFLFAQTHQINLIGLVASLGVGGVAIAFASQKVLEQILWSVVLYIDRPFTVDDYIHLPDGILGRVESIGWRSTDIRLSGKNTLVIVPNSHLAQVNIENLTRARRVISIVNLTFLRAMSDEEKALIRQLIIGSTSDILGIDHQLTKVTIEDRTDKVGQNYVQAQVNFFILGAAETSMELRKNLLEIARQNMIQRLNDYGITFKLEQKTIDVVQPMNI